MTKVDKTPSRASRMGWAIAALFAAGACYLTAMTWMVDLGAAHHDAFCPEHGWSVVRS